MPAIMFGHCPACQLTAFFRAVNVCWYYFRYSQAAGAGSAVIPAQAGIQKGQLPINRQQSKDSWIPASAGMTVKGPE